MVTGWLAVAWLAAWTVPLSITDARTGRLPSLMVNGLLAGLVVLTLAGVLASGSMNPAVWSSIGAAAFGGCSWRCAALRVTAWVEAMSALRSRWDGSWGIRRWAGPTS